MRRFVRGETFDERPLPECALDDLDFDLASETFSNIRKLTKKDLDTLRLRTSHQGRKVPTIGGMLLFGRDRLSHFPDAWIQVGRFAGTDKSTILDQSQLRMPLVSAIESAVAFIEKHSTRGASIGRVKRLDQWNLPPAAVREAITNAVVHADYSQQGVPIRIAIYDDRMEVESPGLLPFGLTLEDLPLGVSKLRNRVIGRVFHELGLVEQWGSGIQRMLSTCREAGLSAPIWEEIGVRVRVTISSQTAQPILVDAKDQAILELLRESEGLSTSEIADGIGLSPRTIRTRIARLVSRGIVREIGFGPTDPRRRYHLAQ